MIARNNRRREAARLWEIARDKHAEYEARFVPRQRDAQGRIRLDADILLRPRDGAAAHLLALLGMDSPKAFLDLYAKELGAVPVVGRVRANRIPLLGVPTNKSHLLALVAGLGEAEQRAVLQGMAEIERRFWRAPQVTRYLAERRAGGLREIPPALLARHQAVRVAVSYLQERAPAGETVRLAGVGVGSGEELVRIATALAAQGRNVEVNALEWNEALVAEANAELQEAGVRGQVVWGNMDSADDLERILAPAPHLLIDHWAGCYDNLVVQKARYAFIRERAHTAILTAVLTDEWGVGRMISGERKRNLATMAALVHRLGQVQGGLIEQEGEACFAYPSQLRVARRLLPLGRRPAARLSAIHGWLSTLLPAEMSLGPLRIRLPDGQDALRVSAPYGATLQVRTCRYPLAALKGAAISAGWRAAREESTLFGAGAVLLLEQREP